MRRSISRCELTNESAAFTERLGQYQPREGIDARLAISQRLESVGEAERIPTVNVTVQAAIAIDLLLTIWSLVLWYFCK